MIALLYLFALITAPYDKPLCDLWTREFTRDALIESCGSARLGGLVVQVFDLEMKLICRQPAEGLEDIEIFSKGCGMTEDLDQYVLRLVEPNFTEIICMVKSENATAPILDEVRVQCPQGVSAFVSKNVTVRSYGVYKPKAQERFICPGRTIAQGGGLYQQVSNADALFTDDALNWLAGKLIWTGYVASTDCGGSGLDPVTLAANPCGMRNAKPLVIQWQNQFNAEIYSAAISYNVPAKLLKRMMMIESQFWIFYQPPVGEVGVMQVTDNGLDTLLRFDPAIDPFYLARDDQQKQWSRNVTRREFVCENCNTQEAINHIKTTMPYYARLIAAYHCRAVTINPALTGEDAWRQAVVDYNGSAVYLERIEQ